MFIHHVKNANKILYVFVDRGGMDDPVKIVIEAADMNLNGWVKDRPLIQNT